MGLVIHQTWESVNERLHLFFGWCFSQDSRYQLLQRITLQSRSLTYQGFISYSQSLVDQQHHEGQEFLLHSIRDSNFLQWFYRHWNFNWILGFWLGNKERRTVWSITQQILAVVCRSWLKLGCEKQLLNLGILWVVLKIWPLWTIKLHKLTIN